VSIRRNINIRTERNVLDPVRIRICNYRVHGFIREEVCCCVELGVLVRVTMRVHDRVHTRTIEEINL
jgi:hypothetical protein